MTPQAAPPEATLEEQLKRLRLRKVYIQLRIPRARAEIAAIATRKKAMSESGSEASKDIVEERIYCNQHLLALRKELQSLEEARKEVFQDLRRLRPLETGETVRASARRPDMDRARHASPMPKIATSSASH